MEEVVGSIPTNGTICSASLVAEHLFRNQEAEVRFFGGAPLQKNNNMKSLWQCFWQAVKETPAMYFRPITLLYQFITKIIKRIKYGPRHPEQVSH
jgi:hypothetical protein